MSREGPAGFLSYVRADDAHDRGMILGICERLSAEVHAQIGHPFRIFVDRNIEWGENWKDRIEESLVSSSVLIAIITPRYFESAACRDELAKFLDREAKVNRKDLILPIHYIDTPKLENPGTDELAIEVARRQWVDWRDFRHMELHQTGVRRRIEDLARRLRKALERGATTGLFPKKLGPLLQSYGDLLSQLEPDGAFLLLYHGRPSNSQYHIRKEITSIGRDPSSDIFLDHIAVSRFHAEVRRSGSSFRIRDLNSKNGLYVNGERVQECPLELGDDLQIGGCKLTFLCLG